jgi:hypothetical protein
MRRKFNSNIPKPLSCHSVMEHPMLPDPGNAAAPGSDYKDYIDVQKAACPIVLIFVI